MITILIQKTTMMIMIPGMNMTKIMTTGITVTGMMKIMKNREAAEEDLRGEAHQGIHQEGVHQGDDLQGEVHQEGAPDQEAVVLLPEQAGALLKAAVLPQEEEVHPEGVEIHQEAGPGAAAVPPAAEEVLLQ